MQTQLALSIRRAPDRSPFVDAGKIVTTSLVDGVNANLPTFQRYLKLRQRMMGVDQLHYYDLYAPLVSSVARSTNVPSPPPPNGPSPTITLPRLCFC